MIQRINRMWGSVHSGSGHSAKNGSHSWSKQ